MGEFADYFNERWADGDFEEDPEDDPPPMRTCRYCGQKYLKWGVAPNGGWRLIGRDLKPHTCGQYKRE